MPTLSEARLQHIVDLAQLSLHTHELYSRNRDAAYQEILAFVDGMVDLMLEVRRERAALEQLAGLWDECLALPEPDQPAAALARRMCGIARAALELPDSRGAAVESMAAPAVPGAASTSPPPTPT